MFNNAQPIVPPMKNVVGDTHAETKAEIEARQRAQMAADAAMLAAREAQNGKKKSPWLAFLTILFAVIALAAAGFAVYEYHENDQLKAQLESANKSYSAALETAKEYEEANKSLLIKLKSLENNVEKESQ
ncbi:hypothetical protein IIZ77_00210 [Candidatus Saccharibacteria bacterium]|nr:hypothetical protein [Candidatus Saccharibacteria bacterium]